MRSARRGPWREGWRGACNCRGMQRCASAEKPARLRPTLVPASRTRRQARVSTRAMRVVCSALCWAVFVAAPTGAWAAGETATRAILVERGDLDPRLETTLIDQPRWLRNASAELSQAAGSFRLFLAGRSRPGTAIDSQDSRRSASALRIRELSFPVRKLALGRSVARAFVLQLNVGWDREIEAGGVGAMTPSFGLQFERRFQ
jgi:hypothetical protein